MFSRILTVAVLFVFLTTIIAEAKQSLSKDARKALKDKLKLELKEARQKLKLEKKASDLDLDSIDDEHLIEIQKNGGVNLKNKAKNFLEFYIVHIKEIDNSDLMINETGHHYKNSKAWTFQHASATTDQDFEGLLATIFTFNTTFGNGATLTLKFIIFRENGTMTLYGEEHTVMKGTTKFTMEMVDWPFCGTSGNTCSGTVGSYLDIDFVLAGENKGQKKRSNKALIAQKRGGKPPKSYDLGEARISFSTSIEIDSSVVDMPEPFPQERQQGNKYVFSIRCPKFTSKCEYDPTMELTCEGGTCGSSALSLHATLFISIITATVSLVISGTV